MIPSSYDYTQTNQTFRIRGHRLKDMDRRTGKQQSEIYAFTQWLPASGYAHANAPEMEVYLPGVSGAEYVCEFWLPVMRMP